MTSKCESLNLSDKIYIVQFKILAMSVWIIVAAWQLLAAYFAAYHCLLLL